MEARQQAERFYDDEILRLSQAFDRTNPTDDSQKARIAFIRGRLTPRYSDVNVKILDLEDPTVAPRL